MDSLFETARANELITEPANDLYDLWLSLGKPEPPDGPSTDYRGVAPAWLNDRELEGLSDSEAEAQAQRYNTALEQLFTLTGLRHAGGNFWNSSWGVGSPEWQVYHEQSLNLAYDYTANHLWERFCDSM